MTLSQSPWPSSFRSTQSGGASCLRERTGGGYVLSALPSGTIALVICLEFSPQVCVCVITQGLPAHVHDRAGSPGRKREEEQGWVALGVGSSRRLHQYYKGRSSVRAYVWSCNTKNSRSRFLIVYFIVDNIYTYVHIRTHRLQSPLAPGGGARHAALRLPCPARGTQWRG